MTSWADLAFLALGAETSLLTGGAVVSFLSWRKANTATNELGGEIKDTRNDENPAPSVLNFLYLDAEFVRRLYSQLPPDGGVPAEITKTTETGTHGLVKVAASLVSANVGRKHASKEQAAYKVEASPERMFIIVRDRLRAERQLETIDLRGGFDMSPMAELAALLARLSHENPGYKPLADLEDAERANWVSYQRGQGAARLMSSRGWVEVTADCQVKMDQSRRSPVFTAPIGSPGAEMMVIRCARGSMTAIGDDLISNRKSIPLTCIGQATPGDPGTNELIVSPVAIF